MYAKLAAVMALASASSVKGIPFYCMPKHTLSQHWSLPYCEFRSSLQQLEQARKLNGNSFCISSSAISFGPKHLTSTPATPIIARLAATTQWAAIRWLEHAGYQQMRQNWPTVEISTQPALVTLLVLKCIYCVQCFILFGFGSLSTS